jgi:hypothetical protein
MKKVTITNDFHGTEITLIQRNGGYLTRTQILKARRTLCGISDCRCGGALGERGCAVEVIDTGWRQGGSVRVIDHSNEIE